jgi:Fe-S cluster biogenesis protein NfuA
MRAILNWRKKMSINFLPNVSTHPLEIVFDTEAALLRKIHSQDFSKHENEKLKYCPLVKEMLDWAEGNIQSVRFERNGAGTRIAVRSGNGRKFSQEQIGAIGQYLANELAPFQRAASPQPLINEEALLAELSQGQFEPDQQWCEENRIDFYSVIIFTDAFRHTEQGVRSHGGIMAPINFIDNGPGKGFSVVIRARGACKKCSSADLVTLGQLHEKEVAAFKEVPDLTGNRYFDSIIVEEEDAPGVTAYIVKKDGIYDVQGNLTKAKRGAKPEARPS